MSNATIPVQNKKINISVASEMLGLSPYTLLSWKTFRKTQHSESKKWYFNLEDVAYLAVLADEYIEVNKKLKDIETKIADMIGKKKVAGLIRGFGARRFADLPSKNADSENPAT